MIEFDLRKGVETLTENFIVSYWLKYCVLCVDLCVLLSQG